jgi:hypothetical protein
MNGIKFIEFREFHRFIEFTFKNITTALNKEGEEKNNKMPNWRKIITKDIWKNFVDKSHDGYTIITGERSFWFIFFTVDPRQPDGAVVFNVDDIICQYEGD